MEKLTLLDTLKSGSMKLSLEEIQKIMNDELNKNPDEMDTELIDLCADVLDKAYFGTPLSEKNQPKRIKSAKVLLIAAIIVILLGTTVSVGAKYVSNDASNKIVQYFENSFILKQLKGNHKADEHSNDNDYLISRLKEAGFGDVILPSVFLGKVYSEDDILIEEDENFLDAIIYLKQDSFSGYIGLTKFKNDEVKDMLLDSVIMGEQYHTVKQIEINSMDVIIFAAEKGILITYLDDDIEYDIDLSNCDLDTAIEIAESLGNY